MIELNTILNLKEKLPAVFPEEWKPVLTDNLDNISFRSLSQFKVLMSKLKLSEWGDSECDCNYKQAVKDLVQGNSNINGKRCDEIRDEVRSKLRKRGLITDLVYENYRYSDSGVIVDYDVGKYAAGEPDCVITPNVQYVGFFYELYINVSYPYTVPDELIKDNIAKVLAAVEELERQHIQIKITLVIALRGHKSSDPDKHVLISVPVFNHYEHKTVPIMASVLNERFLRKFCFAIEENIYKDDLSKGYGIPIVLPNTVNIAEKYMDAVDLFEQIYKAVGADNVY